MRNFPILFLTVFTFLNLFDLLECLVMLLTVIKFKLLNHLNRAIAIMGLSWFNWCFFFFFFFFAPEFQCCYFCESSCLFYLSFNFDFYVSYIMHL